MKREVILRPEAKREIAEAYGWYEEKRDGLGNEFLLVVDAAIERIRREPESHPVVHRDVRRALTQRFPYGVFYVADPRRITVIAVFHGSRDPAVVEERH